MKKLFVLMAAAFAMVACQTDINEVGVVADGVATVEFEVGAPQMRAYSDGLTVDDLQYAVYEVKGEGENKTLTHLSSLNGAKKLDGLRTNVQIELANNKKYAVIFWADDENAPYEFKPADKTVTVDYNNAVCNDESRDAFYAYKEFEVKGAATLSVELRRPFAQVNVGTSDLTAAQNSGFNPSTSALVVKNACNVLNLVTGEATGGEDVTFNANAIPAGEEFKVVGYDYLAMSYVLVGKDKGSYDVTYTITAGDNTVITNTIGAVPMQANYRTNIYGKLLTSTTDINVEIKPGYNEPANELSALQKAALNGGTVTLTEDVVLTTPLNVLAEMTIDLNGKTITGPSVAKDADGNRIHSIINNGKLSIINGTISSVAENGGSAILNYGTLTLNDVEINGAPIVDGGWPSYAINNYGNLTVNSADIKTYHGAIATGDRGVTVINDASVDVGQSTQTKQTSWALYVFEDGQLTVNGGIFKNTKDEKNKVYGGGYICAISTKETIINGGTFEKTEADNNGTGIYYNCTNLVINGGVFDTNPTKYVADGYKTIVKDGKYYVVADDVDAVVSTQSDLESALTAGGDVVLTAGTYTMPAGNKFTAETVLTCEEGVVFEGTSGLNINGATIVGATFKNEGGIAVSGTIYGTLKNCTFEGEEALRWCYSEAGKTVVFENCVINNDYRGFHFDGMDGDVLFKNCHINGFNAYGGEGTATFEGCTFGTDDRSSYNGLNIYSNTVLTDCTFVFKSGKTNFIDFEEVGKTLTITNCTATLDGATVNIADYVGGSKLPQCTVIIDGETVVSDAASLKKAIINGGNIAFAKDITVDEWIMFSEDFNISNGTIITIDNINVTIDGKGHTLTVNAIESAGNGDQLFQGASVLNISNLTIKYADGLTTGGLSLDSGVIKNVHFIGGGSASASAAIFPHNGVIKVEDCIFDTNGVAFYFEHECDNLSVTGCTFNQKPEKNVILLRGDVKFTDNIINSGRTVNVVSGSPVVTGNNFNNVRFKVYGAAAATISNNTINNLEFDGTTYASTFSGNTLSAAAQAALNAATKVN